MAKKTQLSYKEIEERLRQLKENNLPADEIGYSLLYAFGKGERDIARMREGKGIIKTFEPGLLIKGEFCYRATTTLRLVAELEELKADVPVRKAAPKIIAVSDGKTIRAYDLRQQESFEQQIDRLYCDFEFFYPLAGVERIEYVEESPADIKAAEKLAKLHDEIRAYNEFTSDSDLHDLNIFIARLLFCFFAEDTGIFEPSIFTDTIKRYTLDDGSDLNQFLDDAFFAMATEEKRRPADLPSFIRQFPFVSGGLFTKLISLPQLSARARKIIIECGDLDWQNINPDIFGSMIQAVVNPDERATQGMHYTSVPNIMKVINPLFLDELRDEYMRLSMKLDQALKESQMFTFDVTKGKKGAGAYAKSCEEVRKGCNQLLQRISKMKFFDPACGSGNFLIITYKMLRLMEIDILHLMQKAGGSETNLEFLRGSVISIHQFYGIELLDFPHEIAMLSLWLAEHQMNKRFYEDFGVDTDALPLKDITQIKCGNACRVEWNEVCPHTKEDEVFIFGNPPYYGARNQVQEQKIDMNFVFGSIQHGMLDYIASWFYKASLYIKESNGVYAFVSTNSLTQGAQVPILWPIIEKLKEEICFAYKSFEWSNNAKHKAAVICVILGVSNSDIKKSKKLYDGENYQVLNYIPPTLETKNTLIISAESQSICGLTPMLKGSLPADDNNLTLYFKEREELLLKYPFIKPFIKKFVGSQELIKGEDRYCFWIDDDSYESLKDIPELKKRFDAVSEMRLSSKKEVTKKWAAWPYKFTENRFDSRESLVIPVVSSGRREYIPIAFVEGDTVIYYSSFAIYGAGLIDFSIITSKIHMLWARATGGQMKSDFRYSVRLSYNTFPFPKLSDSKKSEIEDAATEVLLRRERYLTVGKTLADLYDPDTMPDDLREAHARLDDIVESCYPGYPFASDEARLECLFKMYEKMTKK